MNELAPPARRGELDVPDNPEADYDPDEIDAAADRYEHVFDKQWGD